MRRILLFLLVLTQVCATAALASDSDANIDYSRLDAWLAHPGLHSAADLVPEGSGYSNLAETARADVFYVHPTTGMREDIANVPIDDPQAIATGRIMLMAQATPFNGIARIYAPRYRQIALHVYDKEEATLQGPMNLAYADVRRAFSFYVEHWNQGRPFFLVAHSQGSNHALRLLMESIQGRPLQSRLVAAYLPGMPTPRTVFTRHLTGIPTCATAEQIGCVAIWGVFAEGYREFGAWEAINVYWDAAARRWRSAVGMPLIGTNPVSWRENGLPVPARLHQGAVPFGVAATHFSRPVPHLVTARVEHGYTLVSPALPSDLFDDGGTFEQGNNHVYDISLFWVDLRANARRRLVAFLARHEGAGYPLIDGPIAATATVGRQFQLQLSIRNKPAILSAEGLPQGLQLNQDTGEIMGVPVAPGHYAVVITASNAAGSAIEELALTVDGSLP
ncbi:MAG: DUF3089 domain-containing protein [Hyphomicrobiaceae bacterium]|nr:DUF3089 domain-containing protein [Hyphomicrobiaceae bacterium]